MKILIPYDSSGPKAWRLLWPVSAMTDIEFSLCHRVTEDLVKDIDILFFNRLLTGVSIQQVIDWRTKYGFSIIVDFDDHWKLGPDHYLYQIYQQTQVSDFMEAWIKEADAVTVTHERLRDEVLPINKNVHILPNAIPDWGQFAAKKILSDFTRLFWAGGVTHKKDLSLLKNPLKRLKNERVQMVMGGYVKKNPEWETMASAFTNGGRLNHEIIESLPIEDYYYTYSKCDISLIPLIDNAFNSFKSNLKILEAANIAAPVIVSKVHPYLGFPDELVNYVEKQSDWNYQINKLLRDSWAAKKQGENLKEYCLEFFNFDKINEQRKELFYSIKKQL